VATASNKPGSYSQSQLRAVLSAGIKQLEEDMDVLIVKQPLRSYLFELFICLVSAMRAESLGAVQTQSYSFDRKLILTELDVRSQP
jgi:hypothetical protein